jgi:hypothetical protein
MGHPFIAMGLKICHAAIDQGSEKLHSAALDVVGQ